MLNFEKDEHIILEIRKHWFILLSETFYYILLALIPFFLLPIFETFGLKITLSSFSFYLFFCSLWVLLIWLISFIVWTNYYLDVWIVTNRKIFDVDQNNLFSRDVSVLAYEKIQDIKCEVIGIIPSVLNFGKITIQTAGTDRNFVMEGVRNPAEIQKKINDIFLMHRRSYLSNRGLPNDFNSEV